MKRIFLIILTSIICTSICFSQDIITKKSSEDIQSKVLEITATEIKYKKYDNQNGPTFIVAKSEVLMIRYENGTKDIFNEVIKNEIISTPKSSKEDLYFLGQTDALRHYKGYKGSGTATLVTSIVLSPLVGLIPAIACSSTQPKEINLNYPNPDLMKNFEYNRGYNQCSKKIKQRKVWTNWGIAFGINFALILILTSE